jgi:hypothetical protein
MARARTPTSVLDARGAFKRHPERKRTDEPIPTGPFNESPPDYFDAFQVECWENIILNVLPGVLKNSDELIVEISAVLLAEFRTNSADMETARIARLTAELGKLGFSPSDRAKLTVAKPVKNEFSDL